LDNRRSLARSRAAKYNPGVEATLTRLAAVVAPGAAEEKSSLEKLGLENCDWKVATGKFGLGNSDWEIRTGKFGLGNSDWKCAGSRPL
jgi:hypothetical protein